MELNTCIYRAIGLEVSSFSSFVDEGKVKKLFDEKGLTEDVTGGDYNYENCLKLFRAESFAELLYNLDETDCLSYRTYREDEQYLFYEPTFPWERKEEEPETLEDAQEMIIRMIQKVTNVSADQILSMINYELFVEGED